MAVLQSQEEMTAELVRPVLMVLFAVINISVLRLSSPMVLFSTRVMPIMTRAITKPTPATTALERNKDVSIINHQLVHITAHSKQFGNIQHILRRALGQGRCHNGVGSARASIFTTTSH
jgi:hypothetical protein